jgi:hypothetical protein
MRSQVPSSQLLVTPPPSLSATPGAAQPAAPSAAKPTGLAALSVWYSVGAGVGGLALLFVGVLGVRRARKPDALTDS